MKFVKKFVTLFLALTICLNFCGCFDKSWAIKSGDDSLSTGIYVFFLMQAHQEAVRRLSANGDSSDDIINATIDGQSAPNWIVERALSMCKEVLTVEKMFAENGMTLTEADEKQIQDLVESIMSSSSSAFESSGISRADVQRAVSSQIKRNRLFVATYGKDGSNPVPDEELNQYYKDNYLKLLFYSKMPTPSTESGNADNSNSENNPEAANKENQKVETEESIQNELNAYADAINNGSKSIDQIREEIKKSASAPSGTDGDPLVEQIINPNSPTLAAEIAEKIKTLEKGKSAVVKFNNVYFLIYNGGAPSEDIDFSKEAASEQKPESTDSNQDANSEQNQESNGAGQESQRDTLLSEMKNAEFEDKIKQKLDSLSFSVNYNAVNQFNPLMFNKLINAAA